MTQTRPAFRRRTRQYPVSLRVSLDQDTKDTVDALADRHELPAAEIYRDAIARGLPLAKAALRRRKTGRRHPDARLEVEGGRQ